MNDYFSQIGESLNANNHSAWSSHEYFRKITPRNVFLLNVVDEKIDKKYVNGLDVTKPSGITNLNSKLLCVAFKIMTPRAPRWDHCYLSCMLTIFVT